MRTAVRWRVALSLAAAALLASALDARQTSGYKDLLTLFSEFVTFVPRLDP